MSSATSVEDEFAEASQCWCCGTNEASDRLVHLGNHPEVVLCLPCARWASKQADEIEDRSRSGLAVRLRGRARTVRRVVIQRGWHRLPVLGAVLRRLGRYTP